MMLNGSPIAANSWLLLQGWDIWTSRWQHQLFYIQWKENADRLEPRLEHWWFCIFSDTPSRILLQNATRNCIGVLRSLRALTAILNISLLYEGWPSSATSALPHSGEDQDSNKGCRRILALNETGLWYLSAPDEFRVSCIEFLATHCWQSYPIK